MSEELRKQLSGLGVRDLVPGFAVGATEADLRALMARCIERFDDRCCELRACHLTWDPRAGTMTLPPGEGEPSSYEVIGLTSALTEIVAAVDDEWKARRATR